MENNELLLVKGVDLIFKFSGPHPLVFGLTFGQDFEISEASRLLLNKQSLCKLMLQCCCCCCREGYLENWQTI